MSGDIASVVVAVHEIRLPSGHVAIVDAADRELVAKYRWNALVRPGTTYAMGYLNGRSTDRSGRRLLHRLLMDPPGALVVDHINGDGLDNRRSNLRLATRAQNNANGRIRRDNTSGYRGVRWEHGKWLASLQLRASGDWRRLGRFDDPWEAAQAWNAAALEEWGEFARLNTRNT